MNRVSTAVLIACGLMAACSGPGGIGLGGKAEGSLAYQQSCNTVYTAALMAVPDVGYRVSSSDRVGGIIVASQDTVLGGGSSVGLTVLMEPQQGHSCLMRVSVTSPPAGLSLTPLSSKVDSYIGAVQARTGPGRRVAEVGG